MMSKLKFNLYGRAKVSEYCYTITQKDNKFTINLYKGTSVEILDTQYAESYNEAIELANLHYDIKNS